MDKTESFLKRNKKLLKNYFSDYDPLLGDSCDNHRFLLNVRGLRKVYLPECLKSNPLIVQLVKSKSLSKFFRSQFFKTNYNCCSHFFLDFKQLRIKHDFPFWAYLSYPYETDFKKARTLVSELQYRFNSRLPLRIFVRKNLDDDFADILNLFCIWMQYVAEVSLNSVFIDGSSLLSLKRRRFFKEWNCESPDKSLCFKKTDHADTMYFPFRKSRLYFFSASDPNKCRGMNFAFLFLSDVGMWKKSVSNAPSRYFSAAFPVIPNSYPSAIILESGPFKMNSPLKKEFSDACNNISVFKSCAIPWHHDPSRFLRFDFPDEKTKFFRNLIKYRKRKTFPRYKNISGRYLYLLWSSGIPLEALHWYVAESTFYKNRPTFLNHYPPSP